MIGLPFNPTPKINTNIKQPTKTNKESSQGLNAIPDP